MNSEKIQKYSQRELLYIINCFLLSAARKIWFKCQFFLLIEKLKLKFINQKKEIKIYKCVNNEIVSCIRFHENAGGISRSCNLLITLFNAAKLRNTKTFE